MKTMRELMLYCSDEHKVTVDLSGPELSVVVQTQRMSFPKRLTVTRLSPDIVSAHLVNRTGYRSTRTLGNMQLFDVVISAFIGRDISESETIADQELIA